MSRRAQLRQAATLAFSALWGAGSTSEAPDTRSPREAALSEPQAPMRRWTGSRHPTGIAVLAQQLTPSKIAGYLQQANEGDPRSFAQLVREIQDRDAHIVAALGVRKRAVANLPWELVPATEDAVDRQIAEICTQRIRQMTRLRQGLLGLLDAVMTGYAGAEIEWQLKGGLLVPQRLLYRPSHWLKPDPDDYAAWRVIDDANLVDGVPLAPYKWVMHLAQAKSGWPIEAGLGRVLVWWYLFKNYGLKDWVSYNEKFGSPLRLGKYPVGTDGRDIDKLDEALRQLGVDASACIPTDMSVEFVADSGSKTGNSTHEAFQNFANHEISKVLLGSTLTIEGGPNGTQALGTVHNDVRADIRDADALELAETLTRDLVRPMVALNWGGQAQVPEWRFETDPAPDRRADAEAQEVRGRVFAAARTLGVTVSMAQLREELDLRAPEAGESVLPPVVPVPGGSFRLLATDWCGPGCRHEPIMAAARGQVSAVVQFEDLLGAHRKAILAAWQEIVDQLRREVGDRIDRATLEARLADALRRIDTTAYSRELAEAGVSAQVLGLAQTLPPADPPRPGRPAGSPLDHPEQWAAHLGKTLEDWRGRVDQQRRAAEEAVRFALARTAKDLLDSVLLAEDGAEADAAGSSLDTSSTSPQRTESVLDGAASSSWGAGRWDGLVADASRRPYLRYNTMQDAQVRPAHQAMLGRIYPASHPIWNVWRPPNGYGCRCWVTAHTGAEVAAHGWEITEDYPSVEGQPAVPDAGWQRHHGEVDYDWTDLPDTWRSALNTRQEAP